MMGLFGWGYPPGVTGNEPEISGDGGPCSVCGYGINDCICPECPQCGESGDPTCYRHHGLERSPEQIHGRKELDERLETQGRDWPEEE